MTARLSAKTVDVAGRGRLDRDRRDARRHAPGEEQQPLRRVVDAEAVVEDREADPGPPEREEQAERDPDAAHLRLADDQVRELADGEDEDQVEIELDPRDPLAARVVHTAASCLSRRRRGVHRPLPAAAGAPPQSLDGHVDVRERLDVGRHRGGLRAVAGVGEDGADGFGDAVRVVGRARFRRRGRRRAGRCRAGRRTAAGPPAGCRRPAPARSVPLPPWETIARACPITLACGPSARRGRSRAPVRDRVDRGRGRS